MTRKPSTGIVGTIIIILIILIVMGMCLKCTNEIVEHETVIRMDEIMTRSGFDIWAFFDGNIIPLPPNMPELDTPVTEELQAIDSCDLQVITMPVFRGYYSAYRTNLPDKIEVVWEPYRATWIENGQEQGNLIDIITAVVSNYINYMDVIAIDRTGIVGGMAVMDFNIYFTFPVGSWSPNGSIAHYLYFKWEGVKFVPQLFNEQRLVIGSNSNDAGETISVIGSLPSWSYFNLHGTTLDSNTLEFVYDALLANCKSNATFYAKYLPISQTYLDQFNYQQITLIQ